MILDWISHPHFKLEHKLMAVLYHCGMASKRQLSVITGWTENEIEWAYKRIRQYEKASKPMQLLLNEQKRKKAAGKALDQEKVQQLRIYRDELKNKRDQWMTTFRIADAIDGDKSVLALGKKGIRFAANMMGEKAEEPPEEQVSHYYGVVEILVRLMKMDRNSVKAWLFAYEAVDFLISQYERRKIEYDYRKMIRPDAWARIGEQAFYLEFDNITEGPRKLEKKLHDYVITLDKLKATQRIDGQIKIVTPPTKIVWVTLTPARRDYLERIWRGTKKRFNSQTTLIPDMQFFVAGEETSYLLDPKNPQTLTQ
jgi:hypothetical protein